MPNPFIHSELNTTDPARAKAFYTKLFDWQLEEVKRPDLDYTMIKVGKTDKGGTGGGIMKQMMPDAGSAWLAYVLVDDIKASTEKARSLGATIVKDVTEIPNFGWLSIFVDPTGATLGLWKPAS